jgi:hypothetical protein
MAYYVGTQQFPSIYEASRFLAQNPQPGATITSAPVTPAGMLTKPAPTKQPAPTQTGPIGTPSTPPKQMPGESGPFDPNAPVPTPAPAPQQTGPVGMPSSDPTKTQPGETGPFDPNAAPPAPAPAPEPEAELAPPKPLQDTKEPAPEPEGITTFTFFRGDETGDANPAALYDRGDSTQLSQAELQEYFNDEGSGMLREAFGTFNNYLAYMTEREQLIQSDDYDVGNWDEYSGSLTEDELMLLEGEDLTQYGDDAASDMPELEQRRLLEQSSAYDRWVNSEANQALLEKYGVGSTIYNQDGDKYEWNGSAYVKTVKVDDHAGVGDYVKAGILTAMNYFAGGALTDALVSTGMSATLASGTSAGILNAATQYAATGEVDFGDALDSALSAGLSTEIINQLNQAGVLDDIEEALNNLTQDTVQLADGTELALNGNLVTLADGSTVNYADFITQAAEAGNAVVAEIERSLPAFLDTIADAFEASGAAQGVVNIVEGMTTESQPYPGGSAPQVTINVPEGVTAEVEEAEVPPEEDILADTTQEATGLEASVIEDLFSDYMDEFRQEFEGQQNITIDQVQEVVANALGSIEQPETLTQEQVQQIVNDAVSSIPQADTLSEQQVQDIVNNAVSSIEIPEGITTEEVQNIVNEAVSGIPAGTSPEQVQDIVNEAISGIVIPEGMTPEQVQQIVDTAVSGIQFPEGISTEDVDQIVSEAIRNIEFPEVDTLSNEEVQSIVDTAISGIEFPEGVTAEQVQEIVQQQIANVPEGLTQNEVSDIVSQAIAGIQFPEGISAQDVQGIVDQAVSNIQFPEAVSTEQVQNIVDAAVAGIDIPEGISEEQVGNIVDTAIANIEFPEGVTQEQVNQIVNQAVGDIEFPEGVTQDQVTQIVNTAIAGIEFPEIDTLSTEEVEGIVNTAISGIEFPEGVTADQVLNIVQEQLATQPEDLTANEVNDIVSAAINSIEFPASVTQEEVVDLLSDVQNTLTSDFESYQEGVREELEVAEEERAVLGGQLGTLTEEVADIATDLINVGGDIEDLDQRTQDRLDELGLDLEGIGLLVNVNFEALQEGMLTQESALRELVEETTQQTEQSLTERLEEAEQGFATNLSDTEANLLEQITGVEAGVLQQLAEVEGGLQSQFGEQFEQVQQQVSGLGEQVSGLGEQVAGVGEGIGQLGQALGAGLLGLAAAQPTAQEIAAAMPRQPVKFDPFLKGLSPFQPLTPLSLSPIQEKDATSELNKFIGRQTGMLV